MNKLSKSCKFPLTFHPYLNLIWNTSLNPFLDPSLEDVPKKFLVDPLDLEQKASCSYSPILIYVPITVMNTRKTNSSRLLSQIKQFWFCKNTFMQSYRLYSRVYLEYPSGSFSCSYTLEKFLGGPLGLRKESLRSLFTFPNL